MLKRYERGEVEHVPWLDRLALVAVQELRDAEQARRQEAAEAGEADGNAADGVAPGGLQLLVELPSFPRTVIYQQAAVAVAGHGAPAGAGGATATADAISTPLPGTAAAGSGARGLGGGPLILLHDAEVGRENPAEAKAQKLARSLTRGMVDKRLKPDTEERRRIEAVLDYPPNRCVCVVGGWVCACPRAHSCGAAVGGLAPAMPACALAGPAGRLASFVLPVLVALPPVCALISLRNDRLQTQGSSKIEGGPLSEAVEP